MNLKYLASPFPKLAVHWRAQSLTRDGSKAMALAYLDARDVMDRFDLVCGPGGWQVSYTETPRGRILAKIGIKVGDEWVWKADGAGETAVEGEKGGISDALKRAAVPWGVGRYLYRLSAPWVPCETYEKNGKKHWKAWGQSPWDFVKNPPAAPEEKARDLFTELRDAEDVYDVLKAANGTMQEIETLVPDVYAHITELVARRHAEKAAA